MRCWPTGRPSTRAWGGRMIRVRVKVRVRVRVRVRVSFLIQSRVILSLSAPGVAG